MVPCWETHTDSDTQPRLLSAVPFSILFQDSPSLPREKVIAAEKAEHSVEQARSKHIWSGQARIWVWSIIMGVVSQMWVWLVIVGTRVPGMPRLHVEKVTHL